MITKQKNKNMVKSRRERGYWHSPETKLKLSLSLKGYGAGRKLSEETKRKMSQNHARHWKGKTFSKETREKMSLAQKGKKKKPLTEEQKERIRKVTKKLWESEEYREKQRLNALNNPNYGLRGKHHSQKTIVTLREKNTLEKNPNWLGGKSFEPYGIEFNKKLKRKLRKQVGYQCTECGSHENESNRKLSIHHIDYDKRNNNENNLIVLCQKCHVKTNHNRMDWIEYFTFKKLLGEMIGT